MSERHGESRYEYENLPDLSFTGVGSKVLHEKVGVCTCMVSRALANPRVWVGATARDARWLWGGGVVMGVCTFDTFDI